MFTNFFGFSVFSFLLSIEGPQLNDQTTNYRVTILVLILALLGMTFLLVWFIGLPFLRKSWDKYNGKSANRLNKDLNSLADYINREALKYFDVDPDVSGILRTKTFQAKVFRGNLRISSQGFPQTDVHQFVHQIFVVLNLLAKTSKLISGVGYEYRYSCDWEVLTDIPQNLAEIDSRTLVARREIMQSYGLRLAAKILHNFKTGSSEVTYDIDAKSGIMHLHFKPTGTELNYYGVKDSPNQYTHDAKGIINELASRFNQEFSANKFSLVKYSKNSDTGVSTVVVRLDLLEEKGNAVRRNS